MLARTAPQPLTTSGTPSDYVPGTIPMIQQIQVCRISICMQTVFDLRR
jgi:hypothetical protein